MLKNRVFAVMADRGIRTQVELAERMGLALSNVHNIVNDNFKAIRQDTLEKLCEVLACQPGDLLEYVPDSAGNGNGQAASSRKKAKK